MVRVDVAELADQIQNFGDEDDEQDDDDDDDFEDAVEHMEVVDEGEPHNGVDHAPSVEALDTSTDHFGSSTSLGDGSLNGALTPASSKVNDSCASSNESSEQRSGVATTNGRDASIAFRGHSDTKATEAQAQPDMSVVRLIQDADHSAGKLVNLLAKHFPCFQDHGRFEGRKVRFLKRAQILVADLWAAFNSASHGTFDDIGHITMFAGKSPL